MIGKRLMSTGPLTGYKILDLTRVLAGPFCSMILGDYGADVIKVESLMGDDTRTWGPPFAPTAEGAKKESSYFLGINRNKKSITVNFKSKEGIQIIKDLARNSDVLIENFLPGKLDDLGIGYADISKINPSIIYTSITGYGPTGPSSQLPGYDVIIEAEAGLMHITGSPDTKNTPIKVGVAITDITTGLFAHGAITSALLARERCSMKKGQKVDVSLLECQVASLANVAHAYLIGGVESRKWGTAHASIVPYQAFHTLDGHIVIGAGNEGQFKKLCNVLDCEWMLLDDRFRTNALRVKNRDVIIPLLSKIIKKYSTKKLLEMINKIGIPCGPVNNIEQTFNHPQVIHRNMIQEVDHPSAGKIKTVGIPVKFSNTQPAIRLAPPILGQHSKEILLGMGYNLEKIRELKEKNVIL